METLQQHIRLVFKEAQKARAPGRAEELALAQRLLAYSSTHLEAMLQNKQLFRELCDQAQWHAFPSYWGASFFATMPATAATVPSRNIKALADSWEHRHVGLVAAPRMDEVPAKRHVPCRFGVCVCEPRSPVRLVSLAITAFLRTLPQEDLTNGNLVLRWRTVSYEHSDADISQATPEDVNENELEALGFEKVVRQTYVHVATTNLRPFRPIFLELAEAADHVQNNVDTDVVELMPIGDSDGKPRLFTLYEWSQERLQANKIHDVAACYLSTRRAPIASFRGQAYVVIPTDLVDKRVWSGAVDLMPSRRARARVPFYRQVQRQPADRRRVHASETSAEPEPVDGMGGPSIEMWDDVAPLEGEVAVPDPVAELVAVGVADAAVPDGRQRSSSSSSSSSSSTSSQRSSSCSSEDTFPALRQKGLRKIKNKMSFKFGPCRFTFRPGGARTAPSWQATCPYHADVLADGSVQTACTRTRKIDGGDVSSPQSQAVITSLQDWLSRAGDFESKLAHQKAGDRKRGRNEAVDASSFPSPKQTRKFTPARPRR